MYYIGIDPGVRKSAFCVIDENKKFIDVGFFESTNFGIVHFKITYENYIKKTSRTILEQPDRVDSKSTLKDILNLQLVVGKISFNFIGDIFDKIVTAVQWKGQTKKHHTQRRVLKQIPNIEKYINKFAKSTQHNLYDAAGLALYGWKLDQ